MGFVAGGGPTGHAAQALFRYQVGYFARRRSATHGHSPSASHFLCRTDDASCHRPVGTPISRCRAYSSSCSTPLSRALPSTRQPTGPSTGQLDTPTCHSSNTTRTHGGVG